jgi:uncharacterized protein YeaO (DUF488 family)
MAGKSKGKVQVRRVYEEPAGDEGTRVLVDRIWVLPPMRGHLECQIMEIWRPRSSSWP